MKTVVEPSVYLLGVICFFIAFGQRLSVSAQDDADADSDGDSLASSFFSGESHLKRSFSLSIIIAIDRQSYRQKGYEAILSGQQEVAIDEGGG